MAEMEFGYDPGSLYFVEDSIPMWQEYFYAGYTEREAIIQELGE